MLTFILFVLLVIACAYIAHLRNTPPIIRLSYDQDNKPKRYNRKYPRLRTKVWTHSDIDRAYQLGFRDGHDVSNKKLEYKHRKYITVGKYVTISSITTWVKLYTYSAWGITTHVKNKPKQTNPVAQQPIATTDIQEPEWLSQAPPLPEEYR